MILVTLSRSLRRFNIFGQPDEEDVHLKCIEVEWSHTEEISQIVSSAQSSFDARGTFLVHVTNVLHQTYDKMPYGA
jgi:hypothetical protein